MVPRLALVGFVLSYLLPILAAPPPKSHYLLRTLQSLSEPSLQKRMADLAAIGPESYLKLREIAFDRRYSQEVRAEAFGSMVTLGKELSQKEIKRASRAKDWFLRVLALSAYSNLDAEKTDSLAKTYLLHDDALMVRAAALNHLKEGSGEELTKILLQALKDEKNFHRGSSLWIRPRIARALMDSISKQGHSELPGYLNDLLADQDPLIVQMTREYVQALPSNLGKNSPP